MKGLSFPSTLCSQALQQSNCSDCPGPPAACLLLHLVDLVCVHHDAGTQQEGEHQLVLLKEAAADVAVEAVGQVAIDVGDALLQVVCKAER